MTICLHVLVDKQMEKGKRKAAALSSLHWCQCHTVWTRLTLLVTVLGTSWAQYWGSAIPSSIFYNQSSLHSFCNTGSHHRSLIVVGTVTSILCVAIDSTLSFSALLQSKETYICSIQIFNQWNSNTANAEIALYD